MFSHFVSAVLQCGLHSGHLFKAYRQWGVDDGIHPVAERDAALECWRHHKLHEALRQRRLFAGLEFAGNLNLKIVAFAELGGGITVFFL